MKNCIKAIIGLLLLASCSKETKTNTGETTAQDSTIVAFSDSTILTEPLPTETANMDLFGHIGLAGVKIHSGNVQSTTDEDGGFHLTKVNVVNGRGVIHLEKKGYFPLTRAQEKDQLLLKAKLQPLGNSKTTAQLTFDATQGHTINIEGMKVEIPAHSLVNKNGEPYSGTVYADMFYLSPNNPDFIRLMPGGDMMAIDKNREMVRLFSYGMTDVLLKDSLGMPLQLEKGKTSTLTFPLPKGLDGSLESIPLWYFNEKNGLWEEQGIAYKEGDNYVGQVGHFSWWNCDVLWKERNGAILVNLIHPCSFSYNYPSRHVCDYQVIMNDQYYLYSFMKDGNTIFYSNIPSEVVNIKVYVGPKNELIHEQDIRCKIGDTTQVVINLLDKIEETEKFKFMIIDDNPISHFYDVVALDKSGIEDRQILAKTLTEYGWYLSKHEKSLKLKYNGKTHLYQLPRNIKKETLYKIDLRTYKEGKKNKVNKTTEFESEEEYFSQFFKSNRIEIALNDTTDSIIPLPKDLHVHCNPRITEYHPSLSFLDQFNIMEQIYLTGGSKKIYMLKFSNYNATNNVAKCVIVEKDKMGNILRESQRPCLTEIKKIKGGYGMIIHGGYYNLLCSKRDKEQPEPFYPISQIGTQCVDYTAYTPTMVQSEFGTIYRMYNSAYPSKIFIKIPVYSDEIVNFIDDYQKFENEVISYPRYFGYYRSSQDSSHFRPKLDYVRREASMPFSKKDNLDAYLPIVALELVTHMKKIGFRLFDKDSKGVFIHPKSNALVTIRSDVSKIDVKIEIPFKKEEEEETIPLPPIN